MKFDSTYPDLRKTTRADRDATGNYDNSIPPNFETPGEARARRQHRSKVLRNGGDQHKQLSDKLDRCKKGRRCKSEADPFCVRQFRLWLYRVAMPFLSRGHWTRASVVTSGLLLPQDQLAKFNVEAWVKRVRKRLERSSLRNRKVIGGIDISLNLQENRLIGWQLHLYLLVEGKNSRQLQEAIKATFPPEPTAPSPYKFRTLTDPERAITYLYKSMFGRRSRYFVNGEAQTKQLRLTGDDLRQLLVFLDNYLVGARLLLNGLRRNGKYLTVTSRKQ
jgi:hypothetical protein